MIALYKVPTVSMNPLWFGFKHVVFLSPQLMGLQFVGFLLSPSFQTRVLRSDLHVLSCRFFPWNMINIMATLLIGMDFTMFTVIPYEPEDEFFQESIRDSEKSGGTDVRPSFLGIGNVRGDGRHWLLTFRFGTFIMVVQPLNDGII